MTLLEPYVPDRRSAAPATRRCLHLLVQDLAASEVTKLEAFLRIGRDRLAADWKIVFDGEAHVLVYGGPEPTTVLGIGDNPLELRRISDAVVAGAPASVPTLLRPLQYELVIDTLLDAERKCGGRVANAVTAVTAVPTLSAVVAATPDHPATVPATPLPADARYRLRRWPSAEWIQRSRSHLRLASFLSTRHIDIGELARLANVDLPQCEQALCTLIAHGALDVQPAAAVKVKVQAAAPGPSRSRAAPAPGLLSRIRQRLGLGTSS